MFRASSAHLQEDTVVYMQHMVLSLSMRVFGGLSVHSLSENWELCTNRPPRIIFLYMFRASSAHPQEDTVVYMQNMVLSLSMRVFGGLLVHSLSENWELCTDRPPETMTVPYAACVLLKRSTWGSKHVEENSILWINNNQCIKLVINIQGVSRL